MKRLEIIDKIANHDPVKAFEVIRNGQVGSGRMLEYN